MIGLTPQTVPVANYVAADREVAITVVDQNGTAVPDARVELREPDGDPVRVLPGAPGGVYRFSDVPPEVQTYSIFVSKPLFQSIDPPIALAVPPGDPSEAVTQTITLQGNLAQVRGRAAILQSPGSQVPLASRGSVQLVRVSTNTPVGTAVTPDGGGAFTLSIGVPGQYKVRVSGSGFATRESSSFRLDTTPPGPAVSPPGTVALGSAYVVDPIVSSDALDPIVVPALATFTVNVTGSPAGSVTGRAVPSSPSTPAPAAPTSVVRRSRSPSIPRTRTASPSRRRPATCR